MKRGRPDLFHAGKAAGFFSGEQAEGADFEAGEGERANAGADELEHAAADGFDHPANLAVAAFGEGDGEVGVLFGVTHAGDEGGAGRAVVEREARAELLELLVGELMRSLDEIFFLDVGSRVGEPVSESVIVGEQEEAGRIEVEPADSTNELIDFADEMVDGLAALGILVGGDVAAWFVEQHVDFVVILERLAVEADAIAIELNPVPGLTNDAPVDGHAARRDPLGCFGAGTGSGLRDHAVEGLLDRRTSGRGRRLERRRRCSAFAGSGFLTSRSYNDPWYATGLGCAHATDSLSYVLLRGARQLLTMSGPRGFRRGTAMRDLHVIQDGAMLIRDGVIEQIGPSRRIEHLAEARTADEIDASGRVVMPAFVDCFTQLMAGPPKWETREDSVKAFGAWSPQRLEIEGRKRLRRFLRCGTTLAAASCGYGADEEAELRALRAIDRLSSPMLELVPYLYTRSEALGVHAGRAEAFEMLERIATATLPTARGRRLVSGVVVDDGFPGEALQGYLACASRLGLRAFVEVRGDDSNDAMGVACAMGVAAVLGMEPATEMQAHALSSLESTAVVLLPGRAFQSGKSFGERVYGRRLVDAGAAVALATGFDPHTSATMSMPMILSLACTQLGMSEEEALTAATANAAEALGLGDQAGALLSGMRADFLITECTDYREIPLYFGLNPVAAVVRGGEQVYPR